EVEAGRDAARAAIDRDRQDRRAVAAAAAERLGEDAVGAVALSDQVAAVLVRDLAVDDRNVTGNAAAAAGPADVGLERVRGGRADRQIEDRAGVTAAAADRVGA